MSRKVDLACTVCTEEFLVPIGVYHAHSSVVPCPCCGSTDLVLLGEVEGTGAHHSGPLPGADGLRWPALASGCTDRAVRDGDGGGIQLPEDHPQAVRLDLAADLPEAVVALLSSAPHSRGIGQLILDEEQVHCPPAKPGSSDPGVGVDTFSLTHGSSPSDAPLTVR